MKTRGTQHNRFLRVISIPYRALCKVRDFYVNSIIDCTNSNVVGVRGASQAAPLPRSFSRASSARSDDSEDFRELVRAASASWRSSRLDAELKMRAAAAGDGEKRSLPPRSVSVGMGRIDEERPLNYFAGEGGGGDRRSVAGDGKKMDLKYPRSKSHAVVRTSF
ncbi:uncharacterized protein LOC127264902 [Andrographis paniculata]|uniref:uncharacterized protein LOC127264902 n=1 Tax=Andrographis paniculata TaxID=175694 RepID=UPI0021E81843|nr:uncharacterized protein LOC127264902 [Andrographis paniculata]